VNLFYGHVAGKNEHAAGEKIATFYEYAAGEKTNYP
jgi:hypothetical protein